MLSITPVRPDQAPPVSIIRADKPASRFTPVVSRLAVGEKAAAPTSAASWPTLWTRNVHLSRPAPLVVRGKVVVLTSDGVLCAFSTKDGRLVWKNALSDYVPTVYVQGKPMSPGAVAAPRPVTIGRDIVAGLSSSSCGYVFCVDADSGCIRWQYRSELSVDVHCRGPVRSDFGAGFGKICFRSGFGLTCLNAATGAASWTIPVQNTRDYVPFVNAPVIADDAVYLGATIGTASAYDADTGKRRWTFDTDGIHKSGGVVGASVEIFQANCDPCVAAGRFFTADGLGNMYALNGTTGDLLWKQHGIGSVSRLDAHDRSLYASSSAGFFQLSPDDGHIVRALALPGGASDFSLGKSSALVVTNPFQTSGWVVVNLDNWLVMPVFTREPNWFGVTPSAGITVVGQGDPHASSQRLLVLRSPAQDFP